MSPTPDSGRRNAIPIIYTKGTHYEVGYDVGRTFCSMIQEFLKLSYPLNQEYIPLYKTQEGRRVYQDTLACVEDNFPQYVQEIKGTADGAEVPFYKLFLLHMDEILPTVLRQKRGPDIGVGCSTVCCNHKGQEILGHTEDALYEVMNHVYLVSAHIISDKPQGRWNVKEEKFVSLCYAGHLPGFTMSYNNHGLVFSVNIIGAKQLVAGKTPRLFITRALLAAKNFTQAQQILRDRGCGAGDAVSINMTFLNQEGDRLFHNAEVGPAINGAKESGLSILTISPGECFCHCNKYLRLKVPEDDTPSIHISSERRHAVMDHLPKPKSKDDIVTILGDQSDDQYPIFREGTDSDKAKTVAVGIFDCVKRTWSIYMENPKTSGPTVVLPLEIDSHY